MPASTFRPPTTAHKIAAEVLGTFVLVFLGCGSVVLFRAPGDGLATASDLIGVASIVSVGLSFGLAVLIMAYAVGRISGGHFNPAVTVGACVAGRLPWKDAPLYVVAQFVGATLGALVLYLVGTSYPGWEASGATMGANAFGNGGIEWWGAFVLEAVLTAIFLWVILAVTDGRNEHPALAPLAIGLALAAIHFVAIPATGTSVNPARSFGPALFSGADALGQVWLFLLAPVVGAAIAGLAYRPLFGSDTPAPARDDLQEEWKPEQ